MTELSLILSVLLAIVFILWMRAHKGWTAERESRIDLSNIMRQPKIDEVRERVFADEASRIQRRNPFVQGMEEGIMVSGDDEWPEIIG